MVAGSAEDSMRHIDQATNAEMNELANQAVADRLLDDNVNVKLKVVNAQELLTMQIPPREHILEPIIQTQSTLTRRVQTAGRSANRQEKSRASVFRDHRGYRGQTWIINMRFN